MSGEELSGRAFTPPVDGVSTGNVLKTAEIVAERIGRPPTDLVGIRPSEFASIPNTQGRKIAPESDAIAPSYSPEGNTRPSSILDRLSAFFMPVAGSGQPEAPLVRFAGDKGHSGTKIEDIATSIDRLEKSQQFATGTTLLSSLTQSVMSSSKRLTQGQ
ncbi:hypothetical protein GGE16_005196 [Rhizobium leguminosarum]|uniref:Uncharacterized protein n=1 Tax=Rhizobium leguminosarum TaxID=384 RepID=A0AAE2SYK3_RHILE|nr:MULTISPECIES: hypothetical protein [Rhizobium]MBB4293111.1 hypothetical protein [Rhizobium leguminosarum]MBB4300066.1 hypothetical protein [Rhizobium leguminosarum]MBB4311192.1 hypothetical protein [Rhizobium leguminosarum]MBB4435419.1 hypothetical protein [Rhizobium esperanzae]MBB4532351.1 hypothetical protein [Rhizobium leguminosarum]